MRRAGATLHRGARASQCRGLSCCGAQAPDAQAQWLWLMGLVSPRHVGSSQTRARTRVSCIGRQILNHCATREARNLSFLKNKFIYLFLAVLGLHCCAGAFSGCGKWGLLFLAVHGLLTVVDSLCCGAWALGVGALVVVAHRLSSCGLWALEHRLSSCGTQAYFLHSM